MNKITLMSFLLMYTSGIFANPNYLYVNLHDYGCGMFSVLSYVIGLAHEYEKNPYSGFEVNFENFGLYYDASYGPNWWNYYFEPVQVGNSQDAIVQRFNIDEFSYFSFFSEYHLSRQQTHDLMQKYVRIREDIQRKIDQYVQDQFNGYHVIGIHYRGTDKVHEASFVPHQQVIDCIKNYIEQNQLKKYKIFIASDEEEIITQLLRAFEPSSIVGYSTQRSTDGLALHFRLSNRKLHGEEALIDCVLLSKADILIRTSSNLSRWSSYFNPTMPVIELNQRN